MRIVIPLALFLIAPVGAEGQSCALVPEAGVLVAENGRDPQIAVGGDHILVAHESRARTAEWPDRSPTVLAIDLPLGSSPARVVREGEGFDRSQEIIPRVALTRAGSAPAVFAWTTDLVGGVGCPCWEAELLVPSAPERGGRIARRDAVMDTMIVTLGSSVLALTQNIDGAVDAVAFGGQRVEHHRIVAPRSLASWDWLRISERTADRISIATFRPDAASSVFTLDARGQRIGPLRRLPRGTAWPVEIAEQREDDRDPEIVVSGPGAERRALEGLPRAPRFGPSRIESRGRSWLVYTEGLRARTRMYAALLEPSGDRVSGPAMRLGGDRETGRAAADAYAGHAFVVWVERATRGWETRLAELRCEPPSR